jgi:hypothetical protein
MRQKRIRLIEPARLANRFARRDDNDAIHVAEPLIRATPPLLDELDDERV